MALDLLTVSPKNSAGICRGSRGGRLVYTVRGGGPDNSGNRRDRRKNKLADESGSKSTVSGCRRGREEVQDTETFYFPEPPSNERGRGMDEPNVVWSPSSFINKKDRVGPFDPLVLGAAPR